MLLAECLKKQPCIVCGKEATLLPIRNDIRLDFIWVCQDHAIQEQSATEIPLRAS